MAHPNEDLLRRGYEAFGKGDLDTLRELFSPDITFHSPGRSPIAGDYAGVDETFGFFGKLAELSGGSFRVEVHDILANDEHVVALTTVSGQRDGKSLDDRSVEVYHVKDGKITEAWVHPGDQYAGDEFWS